MRLEILCCELPLYLVILCNLLLFVLSFIPFLPHCDTDTLDSRKTVCFYTMAC